MCLTNFLLPCILKAHTSAQETSQNPAESEGQETAAASDDSPPAKRTAFSKLFGNYFSTPQTSASDSTPTSWPDLVKAEMEQYKMAKAISVDANPLKWWKDNEHLYPNLSKLSKQYLAVQATSVASERVFSTAGDIVTAQRAVLSTENVDMLIFLKKNLKM